MNTLVPYPLTPPRKVSLHLPPPIHNLPEPITNTKTLSTETTKKRTRETLQLFTTPDTATINTPSSPTLKQKETATENVSINPAPPPSPPRKQIKIENINPEVEQEYTEINAQSQVQMDETVRQEGLKLLPKHVEEEQIGAASQKNHNIKWLASQARIRDGELQAKFERNRQTRKEFANKYGFR